MSNGNEFNPRGLFRLIPIFIGLVLLLILAANCYYSVAAGHFAVATLFGKVKPEPYGEGFHFPVNPLYEFHRYDGAGHGFNYWHRPLYRPEQSMDAWDKVFAFFGKHLAG